MPWWGWVLIVLAVIVTPFKLRAFSKILKKSRENEEHPA